MEAKQTCEECKRPRTIGTDGLCHQCRVELADRDVIVIDGEEYVPGGFRL